MAQIVPQWAPRGPVNAAGTAVHQHLKLEVVAIDVGLGDDVREDNSRIGCGNPGAPPDSGISEAEVVEALAAAALIESNDFDGLMETFSDDHHLVYPDGTSTPAAERIEALKAGKVRYESVEYRDQKIRNYGSRRVEISACRRLATREAGRNSPRGRPPGRDSRFLVAALEGVVGIAKPASDAKALEQAVRGFVSFLQSLQPNET